MKKQQKTKTTEKKALHGRHRGANWAYTLDEYGYHIPPAMTVRMLEILSQENALKEYTETLNEFLVRQFEDVAKRRKRWWGEVYQSLGIKGKERLTYDYHSGIITMETATEPTAGDGAESED